MIKELEYQTPEVWLKGHIEVLPNIVGGNKLFIIRSFLEDKPYSIPWENVTEQNLDSILSVCEKGLMKGLKKMADEIILKGTEGKLEKKGYRNY